MNDAQLTEATRQALARMRLSDGTALDMNMIQGLMVRNGEASFVLEVDPDKTKAGEPLRQAAEAAVKAVPGVKTVRAILTAEVKRRTGTINPKMARDGQPQAARGAGPLPGVAAIIAVASGKGGVGKSTVAVNLAVALSQMGLKVGLLDADIYGPSVPRLLGLKGKPHSKDGKKLEPMLAHGLKAISVGMLVDPDQPMIWRGPMVMTALTQLLNDVNWAPLDVLVLDMPPGTGDAQLTVAQRVSLAGAVIVSTPQDIALIDARKGLAMFRRTAVPVFGIVENMSHYICPNCGHEEHLFGHGGAEATAKELGCDFLGAIPLHRKIRETSDEGTPIAALAPSSAEAKAFAAIAEKVAAKIHSADQKPAPRIVMDA